MQRILLLATLLNCMLCFSQDKATLLARANNLHKHLMASQYDSVISYIHPSLFKKISKKEYISDLKLLNTKRDGITVNIINVPPDFNFKEIKIINNNYYCVFYFSQLIKISVQDVVSSLKKELLISTYKSIYNTEKVVFNERENALLVQNRLLKIAIADQDSNYEWKFFGVITDDTLREQLGL